MSQIPITTRSLRTRGDALAALALAPIPSGRREGDPPARCPAFRLAALGGGLRPGPLLVVLVVVQVLRLARPSRLPCRPSCPSRRVLVAALAVEVVLCLSRSWSRSWSSAGASVFSRALRAGRLVWCCVTLRRLACRAAALLVPRHAAPR